MKFTCEVTIEKSRKEVTELFANPAYLGEYQKGFLRKNLISGAEGEQDAISKIYYKQGRGEMELTETITENQLPEYFIGHYHHIHMDNTMKSVFTSLSENQTLYSAEIEYIAFRGFIPKAMAMLMPWIFKSQVNKWLRNFKVFCEKQ